ncbi:alpha/beta fold hydrolase [Streptomyces mirabilis]|uniref:alpha/beta fold hydrolase n=1 Tax=Streptomyces mirabilis TaxID=68239 RepID=UPI003631B483
MVLAHGGFVDGSGWRAVYDLLRADGYHVSIEQNPTLSLDGDATVTRQVLGLQDGPTVLVGHSYGGAVISEAGTHDKVSALVYVAAFAPDKGESVGSLTADPPPGVPVPPILPSKDGYLFLDPQTSRRRSPVTSPPTARPSSRTRRFRGAWTRSAAG